MRAKIKIPKGWRKVKLPGTILPGDRYQVVGEKRWRNSAIGNSMVLWTSALTYIRRQRKAKP